MRVRLRPPAAPLLALAAVFGIVSCGSTKTVTTTITSATSSAPPSSSASGSTPPASPTTTTSSGTGTSGAGTSSGTGAAAVIPHCQTSMLSLSFIGQQGATGHGELGFVLHNAGATSCQTAGFPGVLFLDKGGGPLPTIPTHTTQDLFGTTPLARLVVPPGGNVSFRLGVTHGISSPVGCTTAYGLQVIPPNDYTSVRTTIPGGAAECRTTTVSPLRPGSSAYP
jgi:Protein of unknown function (DUF4232)